MWPFYEPKDSLAGIGPEYLDTVIGARLTRAVRDGAGLRDDLVSRG